MKKASIGIFIILITSLISSCNFTKSKATTSLVKPLTPTVDLSLSGLTVDEASKKVANFTDDNTTLDFKTNIWLDKKWVDTVYKLLTDEATAGIGTDGIRIYFAKKDNGKNTIVIVATKSAGSDVNSESKGDHTDYFKHATNFLSTNDALVQEDYGSNPATTGATLYGTPDCTQDNCNPNAINYVSCGEAWNDVKNFENQKSKTINTESEWFPLDVLRGLSYELNAAITAKIPADGIRIYFGKNISAATNQKHKNRHNFLIITTQTIGNIHQDYYHCYNPTFVKPRRFTKSDDNGEECPNNCNGTSLPQ